MGIRAFLIFMVTATAAFAQETTPTKTHGVLYPRQMVEQAAANAAAYPWAAAMRQQLVDAAAPYMNFTDDQLWQMMFGPNITRSWMVWSDGFCPACKKDVKMYTWEFDPWNIPWKMRCPHCKELFPKNDFAAYHRSGLNEQNIFEPARADRTLLFNADHPYPNDPLRDFGVDDGEGYVDAEGHRWRFIGCYLIYAQWKRLIVDGAVHCSKAYLATGDLEYARRTFLLLDRAADVFPQFDYAKQALVYEGRSGGPCRGQVSVWHDACEEVRYLAESYDRVFDAGAGLESSLCPFLSRMAAEHKLANPKQTWPDIQRNIENGIFRDTLAHREKIESNYPNTDRAIITIKTVLDWPSNREEVFSLLDGVIDKATAVDGLSGEKGLAGYSEIAPRAVAEILAKLCRIEPGFLKSVYDRHPALKAMYRFHIDTWCLQQHYYPFVGDCGTFARQCPSYAAVSWSQNPGTEPSMYRFFYDLYETINDPAFVQVLYKENGGKVDGLPHDLFGEDPAAFQANVQKAIDAAGPAITVGNVNKQQWRLAILRAGAGDDERALWIDYDAGERHSHADGMNIGLFAKGLDLMPELGYPPVGYGGWSAPKAKWYLQTAAHNTVVVDQHNQERVNSGVTTLWVEGDRFRAIAVSDPALYEISRYERLVALADIDAADSYVVDCFRVSGGRDHARFFHSTFGTVTTSGLTLAEVPDYGAETETRAFRGDANPQPGWYADWAVKDQYGYAKAGADIHLRHYDLTANAAASLGEMWLDPGLYGSATEVWIPCLVTRRAAPDNAPLTTTFLAVIDPYDKEPNLREVRRLPLLDANGNDAGPDAAAIEITRKDGRRDVWLLPAPGMTECRLPGQEMQLTGLSEGAIAVVTFGEQGVERAVLCKAMGLDAGRVSITMKKAPDFAEMEMRDGTPSFAHVDADCLDKVRILP